MDIIKHKEEGYWLPSKYAFGVTKGEDLECGGFREFYIFNLSAFLEAINSGAITHIGIYPNRRGDGTPDGSSAIYYRINDLKEFVFWEMPKGQLSLSSFF